MQNEELPGKAWETTGTLCLIHGEVSISVDSSPGTGSWIGPL